MKKGFWGCEACGAAFKPHPNLDFDGSGNRLIPARDFFLEKKQKRARCSGLPSRFILCRTCRAQAACLGGISVCIPRTAGAAYSLSAVRHARTPLWPCACAHRCGSKVRNDAERAANAAAWSGAVAQNSSRRARIAGRCAAIIPVGVVVLLGFRTEAIDGLSPLSCFRP